MKVRQFIIVLCVFSLCTIVGFFLGGQIYHMFGEEKSEVFDKEVRINPESL